MAAQLVWTVTRVRYSDRAPAYAGAARGAPIEEFDATRVFATEAAARQHIQNDKIAWLYDRVGSEDESWPPDGDASYWRFTEAGKWRLRERADVDDAIEPCRKGEHTPLLVDWILRSTAVESEAVEPDKEAAGASDKRKEPPPRPGEPLIDSKRRRLLLQL